MSCSFSRQGGSYDPSYVGLVPRETNYRWAANYYLWVEYVILPVVSFNRRGSE